MYSKITYVAFSFECMLFVLGEGIVIVLVHAYMWHRGLISVIIRGYINQGCVCHTWPDASGVVIGQ